MQSKVMKLTTFAGIKTLVDYWILTLSIMYLLRIYIFIALLMRSYNHFELVIFENKLNLILLSKLILLKEFRNSK